MTESSGMKTGSPEKDIVDLMAFHVNGGALDNNEDNVNATDDLEDMVSDNESMYATGNDDEEYNDDEKVVVARTNLKKSAKQGQNIPKSIVTLLLLLL
jgi:hypothetical protein